MTADDLAIRLRATMTADERRALADALVADDEPTAYERGAARVRTPEPPPGSIYADLAADKAAAGDPMDEYRRAGEAARGPVDDAKARLRARLRAADATDEGA